VYSIGEGAIPASDNAFEVSTTYIDAVCRGDYDSQPDIFYYNLNGASGRFVANQKTNWEDPVTFSLLSQERVNIQYDEDEDIFTITNIDGFRYVFGSKEFTDSRSLSGKDTPREAGSEMDLIIDDPLIPDVVTAWYLDEIISPTGDRVTFSYSNNEETGKSYHSQKSIITISENSEKPVANWYFDNESPNDFWSNMRFSAGQEFSNNVLPLTIIFAAVSTLINSNGRLDNSPDENPDPNVNIVKNFSGSQTVSYPIYLKEISFPNGRLVFHTSDREDVGAYQNPLETPYEQPQKLDSISVYEGSTHKKSIVFVTSYFNHLRGDEARNHLNARLRLDRVMEYKGMDLNPGHIFTYNPMRLPAKNSYNKDYWGYCNGSRGQLNDTGIPTYSFILFDPLNADDETPAQTLRTIDGANKEADLRGSQAATLTGVQYPTGGESTFEYELNKYMVEDGELNVEDVWLLYEESGTLEIPFPTEVTIVRKLTCNSMSCYGANTDEECELTGILSEPYLRIEKQEGSQHIFTAIHADYNCKLYPGDDQACQVFDPQINDCSVQATVKMVLDAGTYTVEIIPVEGFSASVNFQFKQITMEGQSQLKSGGGLRIARILDVDEQGLTTTRKYDYAYMDPNSVEHQGKLMSYPNVFYASIIQSDVGEDVSIVLKMKASTYSNRPLSTAAKGAYVGYDRVTEIFGEEGENGMVISYYKNESDDLTTFPESLEREGRSNRENAPVAAMFATFPNTPSTSYSAKNGLLEKEITFDANGNEVLAVSQRYDSVISTVKAMSLFKPNGCQRGPGQVQPFILGYAFYNETSEWWYLKEKTTRKTQDGSTLTTHATYHYDNPEHRLLTQSHEENSKKDVISTYTLYPQDYADLAGFIGALVSNHILNVPVETTRTLTNTGGTHIFSSNRTVFTEIGNGLVDKIYTVKSSKPVPLQEFVFSNQSEAGVLPFDGSQAVFNVQPDDFTLAIDLQHDNHNNLVEVVRQGYYESTYLWGYNDLLPFIAAENTTFSALEQAARTAILQVTGSHQDIDLFLEEIGGLSTSQQKVAWSEFNQILRGSPALANALVTTYTYAPIIGITSQTDPNGKITYFGYDGLGRLENVKDF
jgi:hypothetical protein